MAKEPGQRHTYKVSDTVFKLAYDAPSALPGKHRWVTPDIDVRRIEEILGIPPKSIGAPLWVSGDSTECSCGREFSWLDIVSSGLNRQHDRQMIAEVILGEQKFVNVEAPKAIVDLHCFDCGNVIADVRSFKCHNWAYAIGDIAAAIAQGHAR